MSGNKLLMATALVIVVFNGQAYSGDDPWFFGPNEIANAHRYQQQFGARLRHPLKPEDCSYGQKEFSASYQGKQFTAPCRFVAETIRQLRELMESGVAKYLFPLDVGHADFGVPLDVWNKNYDKLPREEILPALLRERTLVAVYNTAQHLGPLASKTNSGTSVWGQKRSVIGYYDGRRTKVLPPLSDGTLTYKPEGFHWLGGITLLSHHLGELQFIADETVVMFDMSFDDDRAAAPIDSAVNVSARTK
jgi:hypothetical protein